MNFNITDKYFVLKYDGYIGKINLSDINMKNHNNCFNDFQYAITEENYYTEVKNNKCYVRLSVYSGTSYMDREQELYNFILEPEIDLYERIEMLEDRLKELEEKTCYL